MGNEADYPAPAPVKARGAPPRGKGGGGKAAPLPSKAPPAMDKYGFRIGTMKSKAAALYARKEGATVDEVRDEVNSLQLNLLTTLEKQGFTVKREKEKKPSGRIITRYFLSGK